MAVPSGAIITLELYSVPLTASRSEYPMLRYTPRSTALRMSLRSSGPSKSSELS